MVLRLLAGVIFIACSCVAVAGDAAKNPYLTAKVGDWAKYRMSGDGAKKVDRVLIKTVETVTEQEVGVKLEVEVDGKIVNSRVEKIRLDQPHSIRTPTKNADVTVNGTGHEKVKVAGKEFETTWTSETIVEFTGAWEMRQEIKIWASADAPLDGLVKTEGETTQKTEKLPGTMKRPVQKFQMELLEFGRK